MAAKTKNNYISGTIDRQRRNFKGKFRIFDHDEVDIGVSK